MSEFPQRGDARLLVVRLMIELRGSSLGARLPKMAANHTPMLHTITGATKPWRKAEPLTRVPSNGSAGIERGPRWWS
jgi:hypothetical protein